MCVDSRIRFQYFKWILRREKDAAEKQFMNAPNPVRDFACENVGAEPTSYMMPRSRRRRVFLAELRGFLDIVSPLPSDEKTCFDVSLP